MVSVSDDHGQPIDPFAQIHISAGNHDSADTGSIFKHEAPPATACKAGTLKYRLIIPASGGLIRSLQPESLLPGRLAPVLCPEQFLPGFLQKRGQTGWWLPEVPPVHGLPGGSFGASNSKIFQKYRFQQATALP